MKRKIVIYGSATLGLLALAASYRLGRARAAGIPQTGTLAYTGTLLNNGAPVSGSHFVLLKVLGTADGGSSQVCLPTTQTVAVTNGRFTVPLDASCTPAVHANPDLSIDVTVDGTDLGVSPLTAVPYAVEADTASNYAPASPIANLVPPGTVVAFAGVVGGSVSPPPGWLLCDGSAVSRSQYAALFNAIGTTAGGGDGATTFNLPDYRGTFLRGFDQGSGKDPDAASRTAMNSGGNTGDKVGTVEGGEFGSHSHGVNDPGHSHAPGNGQNFMTENGTPGPWFTGNNALAANWVGGTAAALTGISIQAAGGSETRPVNAAVNYLIKI
ncbi:MAG: tail fiber protein [Deltaproteobacteria bacterium]